MCWLGHYCSQFTKPLPGCTMKPACCWFMLVKTFSGCTSTEWTDRTLWTHKQTQSSAFTVMFLINDTLLTENMKQICLIGWKLSLKCVYLDQRFQTKRAWSVWSGCCILHFIFMCILVFQGLILKYKCCYKY